MIKGLAAISGLEVEVWDQRKLLAQKLLVALSISAPIYYAAAVWGT